MLEYVNRRNSNSYKWDSEQASGNLPLWVADMDFKAAPAIIRAMQERLNHGVFGYSIVPNDYYTAVSSWFSRRHDWHGIKREQLICTIGVVPAISAILRALSDKKKAKSDEPLRVITFTPAYNCFFSCISNIGCELIECRLIAKKKLTITPAEREYVGEHFEVDWQRLEQQATTADVFLLCNPHNPTARVWTKDELTRIAMICHKNNLFVVSDEIHCEFCFPEHQYTPFATVAADKRFCICTSASKAFNIAGLQCANIYVPEAETRTSIDRAINIHEVCDLNPFGIVAAIAAYNESEQWIDELNGQVFQNWLYLLEFIATNMPELSLSLMEGTYLAWLNIKPLGRRAEQFCADLVEHEHVLFNPSEMYGATDYIRINLATSPDNIRQAAEALKAEAVR